MAVYPCDFSGICAFQGGCYTTSKCHSVSSRSVCCICGRDYGAESNVQKSFRTFIAPKMSSLRDMCDSAGFAAAIAAAAVLMTSAGTLPVHAASDVLQANTLARRYVVTDSAALLRYSLPIDESINPPVREAQRLLERVGVDLRSRGAAGSQGVRRDLALLDKLLQAEGVDILLQIPAKRRADASQLISRLENQVAALEGELGVVHLDTKSSSLLPDSLASLGSLVSDITSRKATAAPKYDPAVVEQMRSDALDIIAELEEIMISDSNFPYRIPRRYDALPRLEGRAKVEMVVQSHASSQPHVLEITLDGYSAPLNAGNFVDLVQRRIYDGAKLQSSERGFYVQFSNREGEFRDPETHARRNIPMEILVAGERTPLYGFTLDEAGAGDLQPVLPVTAFGAVASHHSMDNANDASSQWYIFLFDPKSYQARAKGGNALNGSISCFGYVTKGKELLDGLRAGDTIRSARVVSGLNYFRTDASS